MDFPHLWQRLPEGIPVFHVRRQHHLLDQDLSFYSGGVSAALASVLMHELASVMLTHNTAKKAIETWRP
jgi:hypothetical protein